MTNKTFVLLLAISFCSGCQSGNGPGKYPWKYDAVLAHFKHDPEKLSAARFLIDNLAFHYSVKTKYITEDSTDYTDYLSTYSGSLTSKEAQDSLKVVKITTKIYDSIQISPEFLIHSIEESFDLAKKGPVQLKYNREVFQNYLLPYRVGFEEINEWRPYMHDRYGKFLSTYGLEGLSAYEMTRLIDAEQTGTSSYILRRLDNITQPSLNQTVKEIIKVRIPFSCEDYCIRSLYTYRALGIPAAYEIAPILGKFNYGHAQAAYLSPSGAFLPNGDDPNHFKYQIAKMYRRSFSRQVNPFEEIKKTGENELNIPSYFNTPDYIDITKERTDVSDIPLMIPGSNRHKVCYICVYNGGIWQAVDWSRRDSRGKVLFKDMGRKILYHAAYMDADNLHLTGSAFVLDTAGVVYPMVPDRAEITLRLSNYQRHEEVTKGRTYALYCWDNASHAWKQQGAEKAETNLLEFAKVPSHALYKLEESPAQENQEPVRPFTYDKGVQKWW